MRLCSIASGSSGNCIYTGGEHTHLLVDTGISKKRVEEGLKALDIKGEELSGILITHEHIDHVQGLGVFSRKYEVPIYATKGTIEGIKKISSIGKMPEGLFHEIQTDETFTLGELKVEPFKISHDANEPSGYRIGDVHIHIRSNEEWQETKDIYQMNCQEGCYVIYYMIT